MKIKHFMLTQATSYSNSSPDLFALYCLNIINNTSGRSSSLPLSPSLQLKGPAIRAVRTISVISVAFIFLGTNSLRYFIIKFEYTPRYGF